MSGLERFQGTSDWMQRFKSLLSTNRGPKTPTKDLDSSAESSVCLELNEELQTILQEKNIIPKIMMTSFKTDNKENLNPISISSKEITSNISQNKRVSLFDESIMNPSFVEGGGSTSSFEITNISFSAIEQACNKSISDPDSTIHKYVEQIKKNNDSKFSQLADEEDVSGDNETIDRLIRNLEAEELKYANNEKKSMPRFSNNNLKLRQTFGLGDQTQLADVEEPSTLWETTEADNVATEYQISPTKMVGLLRPSTILEESASSNLTNTTNGSFDTAQKQDSDNTNFQSDVTSQYETACETTRSDVSNIKNDIEESTSHHLPSFMQKYKFFDTDLNTSDSSNLSKTKESCGLKSNDSSRNSTIDSFKDDEPGNVIHIHKDQIKKENMSEKRKLEVSPITIEVSDDESDSESGEKSVDKSKENLNDGFSMQNIEQTSVCENLVDLTLKDKGLDISHEFNDTLEEVDYIMKHGMEMLKNSATKPKLIESVHTNSKETIVTPSKSGNMIPFVDSPAISQLSSGYSNNSSKITFTEKHKNDKSPSPFPHKVFSPRPNVNTKPLRNSPIPFNKFISKQNSVNKNAPSSGKDSFRKPVIINNVSKIPQTKSISNIKKSIYSDVISPVGAYIKKTPVCPTESRIKETTIKSLDYGQATGKANVQYHPPKRFEMKKGNAPSLPQKFYKSAEYRCVVDERTPLNIPGGESIHKYLKSALAPAIVRHDGKMKMGSPMKYVEKHNVDVNKTVDSTMTDLADLSTISGDVSIYTLKDAQKFSHVREKNFEYKK